MDAHTNETPARRRAGNSGVKDVPYTASGYRPDVQGLRALAVLLVVGFHLYPNALPGGYVGVDVFFVISGFLITGHLAKRFASTGRVRLLEFYGRRARRLLPAAVLVLVVTWVGSRLLLPVTQRAAAADQIRASALYIQNWVLARDSVDYLHQGDAASPVQHYWSLSVEEQFYLIWPLLFIAAVAAAARVVHRGGQRGTQSGAPRGWLSRTVGDTLSGGDAGSETLDRARRVGLQCATMGAAVIVAASLWFSVHETATNQAAAYFVTPTRLWELGIGGLLALVYPLVSRTIGRIGLLAWIGLGMMLASAFLLGAGSAFPGYIALLPTLGAVLMIAAGSAGARLGPAALFASRPAVFIGDISYSIYLWHWPLIVLYLAYAGGSIGVLDGPVIVAASILLAWATKRWVEDPFRNAKWIAPHPGRSLATVATAIVPVILTTAFLMQQAAHPTNIASGPHPGAQILAEAVASSDHSLAETAATAGITSPEADPPPTGESPGTSSYRMGNGRTQESGSQQASPPATSAASLSLSSVEPPVADAPDDLPLANQDKCKTAIPENKVVSCIRGDTSDPRLTIALVGDSFAAEWSSVLIEIADKRHWEVVTVTHDACPWTAQMLIREGEPYTACHDWGKKALDYLLGEVHPDVVLTSFRPLWGTPDNPKLDAASQQEIANGMVTYWRKLTDAGAYVVGIHPTPDPEKNIPDCLGSRTGSVSNCSVPRSKAERKTTSIGLAVETMGPTHATEIDLNDYICGAQVCLPVVGNVIVYRDKRHLTKTYSMTLAPYLKKALLAVPAMHP